MKSIKKLFCMLWVMVMLIGAFPVSIAKAATTLENDFEFDVQYWANMDVLADSPPSADSKSFIIIDTSGGNLPTNANPVPAQKTIWLDDNSGRVAKTSASMEIYETPNGAPYKYSEAPGVNYIDQITNSQGNFTLSKVEIYNKNGNTIDIIDINDPDSISPSDLVFSNNAQDKNGSDGVIGLAEGYTVKLIYTPISSSTKITDVSFFDYDVTDGDIETKNGKHWVGDGHTIGQGINKNAKADDIGLHFGNRNIYKSDDEDFAKYANDQVGGYYINIANALFGYEKNPDGTFKLNKYGKKIPVKLGNIEQGSYGITVNRTADDLDQAILDNNGLPLYANGIVAPDLFVSSKSPYPSETKVTGKYELSGAHELGFTKVGNEYRFSSATVRHNGKSAVSNDLDKIENIAGSAYGNNFFPLDDLTPADHGAKDPEFGNPNELYYYGVKDNGDLNPQAVLPEGDDKQAHNSYFGMTFDVKFTLPANYIGPLDYLFFGDDNMWIYLIPLKADGTGDFTSTKVQKICDIGGVHSSIGEFVNLWDYIEGGKDGTRTEDVGYMLRFFYLERGASGSACYMEFTLPQVWPVQPKMVRGAVEFSKAVEGPKSANELEQAFDFTVTLEDKGNDGINRLEVENYSCLFFKNGADTPYDYKVFRGDQPVAVSIKNGEYIRIGSLPVGTTYTITESVPSNFTVNANPQTGIISSDKDASTDITFGKTDYVAFTNTLKTGSLSVKKTVSSDVAPPSAGFQFEVTLTGNSSVNGSFGDAVFENGVARFSLGHNETKTITGIPAGYSYEVKELTSDGFTVIATGTSGTIPHNDTAIANLTNAKGGLDVSKLLDGEGTDPDKEFDFTVQLSDYVVEEETIVSAGSVDGDFGRITKADESTGNPIALSTVTFTDGKAEFKLKGGETFTATGLPAHMPYTVTEANYFDDGYVTTSTGSTGSIPAGTEHAVATFTNRRDAGNLTVQKIVEGQWIDGPTNEAQNIEFSFKVVLSGEGTYTVDAENKVMIRAVDIVGEYGDMTFQPDVKNGVSYATFTLKHGKSKTALDLPVGISYTVTEEDTRFTESVKISRTGMGTVKEFESGFAVDDEIPANKTDTVTFTNLRDTGDLVVEKIVTGKDGETDRNFKFTVVLDEALNGTYGDMTFEDGKAAFTLTHNQQIIATGLPSNMRYTVTEIYPEPVQGDEDGYTVTVNGTTGNRPAPTMLMSLDEEVPEVSKDVSYGGTFTDDVMETVTFTNENPGPVEVPLLARKLFDGKEPDKAIFTFVLKDEEGVVLQTKTNDALGAIVFDNLIFKKPGHYTFTLEELADDKLKSDIAFDPSIYTIEIDVVRDEQFDTNGGCYSAYVSYKKDGLPYEPVDPSLPPESVVPDPEDPAVPINDALEPAPEKPVEIPYYAPVFMNTTIPPLPATGDDSNALLWMGILTVSAMILGMQIFNKRRQKS